MVDPVSIVSLAALAGHLTKNIFNICRELKEAPELVKELCTELLALQEALGRISTTCQFPTPVENEQILPKIRTLQFQDMIISTENLIQDLLFRCEIPKGRYQSVKQRFKWVRQKTAVQESLQAVERRRDYFSMILSTSSHEYLKHIYVQVKSLSQRNTLEMQKSLAAWLGAPDYHARHLSYLEARRSGTGSWFTNGPLSAWTSQTTNATQVAWLRGKSGCGKSFIFSHAIEWAVAQSQVRGWNVVYFHCTFQDVATHSLRAVLAALIQQMCDKHPSLWTQVNSQKQNDPVNDSHFYQIARVEILERLFVQLAALCPRLYVFLDAPDESPHSDALITFLSRSLRSQQHVRLLIASRPNISMQLVEAAGLRYSWFDMDSTNQKQDFETYIEGYIQDDESLRTLKTDLKRSIVSELSTKADGSFRWIDCLLQSLSDRASVQEVRHALQTLPPSLERYYREAMAKVPTNDRMHVRRLLRWLITQSRPMTRQELAAAVVLDPTDGSSVLSDEMLLFPGKIERYLRVISSLVQYDARTEKVTLAHSSVKDFLLSSSWHSEKDLYDFGDFNYSFAMHAVLRSCLWYITQEQFYADPRLHQGRDLARWPLYDYCAHTWVTQVDQLSASGVKIEQDTQFYVRKLFDDRHRPGHGCYALWLRCYAPQYVPNPQDSWSILSPLHLAAGRGWLSLVQLICEYDKRDINVATGQSSLTPLVRARIYNHTRVVQYLMTIGAKPNA